MEQIQIMKWFRYRHLPPKLQAVSKACADLAEEMVKLPPSDELRQGLRKLLEAKDAFVRAAMEEPVTNTLEQEIERSAEVAGQLSTKSTQAKCLKQVAPGLFCSKAENHTDPCVTAGMPKEAVSKIAEPSNPVMTWRPVNWIAPPYPCPSCNIPARGHPDGVCQTCSNSRVIGPPRNPGEADYLAEEALKNGWAPAWQFFSTAAAALRRKNTNTGR